MVVLKEGQVIADGTPADILTTTLIADVFHVCANIIIDPQSGSPVCLPYGTAQQTRLASASGNNKPERNRNLFDGKRIMQAQRDTQD